MSSTKEDVLSFEEAEKLRELLRPAFAGYVTDGDVSDRDVLATLMDLIVKGYIGIEIDFKTKPAEVRKIYLLRKTGDLLRFERYFIETLFSFSKDLTVEQFKTRLLSKNLHAIISSNIRDLEERVGFTTNLFFLNKTGKPTVFSYTDMESPSAPPKFVMNVGDLKEYDSYLKYSMKRSILAISAFFAFLVFFYIAANSNNANSNATNFFLPFIALIGVLLIGLVVYFSVKLHEVGVMKKRILFTSDIKRQYAELFEFMRTHTLKRQSLDNEFMPYAVAFGLDKSWGKSFGLEEEKTIAYSEALGMYKP